MGQFQDFSRDPYGFKILDIYNNAAAAAGFSAQYQAVYDTFVVKPAADIATQQDTMVRALVAAGVWNILDVFLIFANNTAANAVINWINPGTYDAIEVNAPTFLAYRHFVGNGVNQYLRINGYNPGGAGIFNYQLNDCCYGFYTRNSNAAVSFDIGVTDAANRACMHGATTNAVGARNYNNSIAFNNDFNTAPVTLGLHVSDRSAAGVLGSYENGVDQGPAATASVAIPNLEWYVLVRNLNGVPASYSTNQHSFVVAGASLGANNLVLFNALETYLDYVGAGVI